MSSIITKWSEVGGVRKFAEYYDQSSDDSSLNMDDTDSDPDFLSEAQLRGVSLFEVSVVWH